MVLQVRALNWDSDLECCRIVTWLSDVVLAKVCDLWLSFYATGIIYFLCLLQVFRGLLGHL